MSGTSMTPDEVRELGLQVATRLTAVVRMGRSYAFGNPVFTGQLEQLFEVLQPVIGSAGEARIAEIDGELHLNELAVPARAASVRFTEQLLHELRVRGIAGLRFRRGLALPELEMFMRYFLPSEVYKGADLEQACAAQGITHAAPMLWAAAACDTEAEPREVPPAYQLAVNAWTGALDDARWLLEDGLPRGVATHHYKRVVRPLVDAALADDPLSAGLADLDDTGDGPWLRGLRVCVLAILVGRALGLDRGALAELGAAALLHGTGGADEPSPADEGEPPGALACALAQRARVAPLDPVTLTALRATLPPTGKSGSGTVPLADVVRIAHAWVSLATRREGGMPRWTPSEALGGVIGPLGSLFHPALRGALVRALGTYPPGQIVELDDGTVARVCAADPADPERPLLEPMTGPGGERLEGAERGAIVVLGAERSVLRAVPFARRHADPGGLAA